MDPLSVITSTITVVQAISSTYKAIQHLRGLPNEFNEVGRNLPLAQDILGLARDQLRGLALDESSKKALQPLVSGCEEKAKMLQDIFEKVEKKVKNAEDGSILTFYRSSLLHLGKAHRVETLMQGILRGLDALATNQLFKTATQSQMAQLKGAIVQLSNVESSILDSDFEGSVTQNIASEGTAHQPVVSGQDRNINSGSGKQCNAHTMTFVQSKEDYKTRGDILQSLHTSPYLDRKNRNPDRVPGTCKWFIDHDHFQQWRERKSSSMLWVSANPGCGKSILAKYLVDSELKTTISRTTSYFFFKDDFEDQRSATSALSCILHQLFTQREIIFSNKIVKRFKAYKAHLTSSFDELWDILVMASQDKNAAELVCILDAFDECKHQERNKLAQALRNFYSTDNDTKNNVNLKFLITSRPYDEISRHFQPLNIPGLSVIHLKGESDAEMSKITQEIDVYIRDRVSLVRANRDLTPEEEQLLLQRLRRVPNQTYMWAYLVLQLIEKDLSIDKTTIREVTSSLPRTVDDVYERILPKNNPRDAEEAERAEKVKKMLHVIVAAARPLTLAEMDLALALQKEHTSYEGWHRKPEERFSSFIRDLCGLFITITDSKICLIHQTAKEFLVAKDNLDPRTGHDNPLKWKYSLQPPVSHRVLCQICIWHLLFTEFETNPLEEYSDDEVSHYLRGHVFLDYSATNWAAHFRASGIENDAVIESVWRICDATSRRCGTWFRVYWANTDTGFPQGFTTLMIASYFGLEQIVRLQLGVDDVDSRDGTYRRSALSWASENGSEDVVKLLIKRPKIRLKRAIKLSFPKGPEVDAGDRDGRTPLSYAAWNGHLAIVQRLVKEGARVDSKDGIGGTPISYALCTGQEATASLLMKGADADSVYNICQELLFSAAEKGNEVFVKRLLDIGVATNAVDGAGRTPLSLAAKNGHRAVVKLLLERGAHIELRDPSGMVPLSWAAEKGHEAVVKLLLERGASFELKDGPSGMTPLSRAAAKGHEAVVKLLLDWGADLESEEGNGRTPLSRAAEKGRGAVVDLLLERGARLELKDASGMTPISWAAEKGHGAVIKLLLERGASFELKDVSGMIPLSWAAHYGHEAVVELLLERGAHLELRDPSGMTPLSWAAAKGHEVVVKLLLEWGADLESKDGPSGMTPLSRAAANGHEAIVKLLLEWGADLESKDCLYGLTPLSRAVENGREAIVKLLLERGADLESKDHYGLTPLSRALKIGHEAVVLLLR